MIPGSRHMRVKTGQVNRQPAPWRNWASSMWSHNIGSHGGAREEHFPTIYPRLWLRTVPGSQSGFSMLSLLPGWHRSPAAWSGSRRWLWEESIAAAERLHRAKWYGWANSSFCSTTSSLNEMSLKEQDGKMGLSRYSHAGDPGLILQSRGSPGEWNGYPLQCSCLENSMDRGAWWATIHGVVAESNMTDWSTLR